MHTANSTQAQNADLGWTLNGDVPGFRQIAGMKRSLGPDRPDMVHMVFSDGLAAISVFIEPYRKEDGNVVGPMKHGAVNVYKRRLAGYVITALGEGVEIVEQELDPQVVKDAFKMWGWNS